MKSASLGVGLTLLASVTGAPPSRHAGAAGSIAWVKDLATAQRLARSQKKLVMQFLMLGDLTDPHC
jgi:hypothetical protein